MRVGVVGLAAMVAACSTTSNTGLFVKDVKFVNNELVVASCDVSVTVSDTLQGASETANLNGCTYARMQLRSDSELVTGAPQGCEASVERWHVVSTAEPPWSFEGRLKLWRTLPRTCRVYLEELLR